FFVAGASGVRTSPRYIQVVTRGRQTGMSEAPHSIAELIEALQDGDFQIRNEAAVALGELGPEARESVPALTQALEGEAKYLHRHAAAALGKIGPAAGAAVPALTRALKDNDEDVRGGLGEGGVDLARLVAFERLVALPEREVVAHPLPLHLA